MTSANCWSSESTKSWVLRACPLISLQHQHSYKGKAFKHHRAYLCQALLLYSVIDKSIIILKQSHKELARKVEEPLCFEIVLIIVLIIAQSQVKCVDTGAQVVWFKACLLWAVCAWPCCITWWQLALMVQYSRCNCIFFHKFSIFVYVLHDSL